MFCIYLIENLFVFYKLQWLMQGDYFAIIGKFFSLSLSNSSELDSLSLPINTFGMQSPSN